MIAETEDGEAKGRETQEAEKAGEKDAEMDKGSDMQEEKEGEKDAKEDKGIEMQEDGEKKEGAADNGGEGDEKDAGSASAAEESEGENISESSTKTLTAEEASQRRLQAEQEEKVESAMAPPETLHVGADGFDPAQMSGIFNEEQAEPALPVPNLEIGPNGAIAVKQVTWENLWVILTYLGFFLGWMYACGRF